MNNKDLVAKAVYDIVKDDLTLEQVEQLLENPKSAEHGDVAFPAFSLAKVYRKAVSYTHLTLPTNSTV